MPDDTSRNGAAGHETPAVFNLPNQLTLLRLLMTPVLLVLLSVDTLPTYAAGYALFIAATLTDYYDGKIARERNLITNFGKLMDPLADKILISTVFIMMVCMPDLIVPRWTVVVIIAREFLVTGCGRWRPTKGHYRGQQVRQDQGGASDGLRTRVSRPGDSETSRGLLASGSVSDYAWILHYTSLCAIIFVALYTVYSGVRYAQLNWQTLRLGS